MPWSNQSGGGGGGWKGGGGGGGPWGQGPSGGGHNQQPDLDDLIKRSQDKLKQALPGGTGIPGPVMFLLALLLVAGAGFYLFTATIKSDELGVVTRFGRFDRQLAPGLHFRLPPPIEEVEQVKFQTRRITEVGYVSGAATRGGFQSQTRDLPKESLMLTGDENIIDINFQVQWSIKDAAAYLFNIQNPEVTVKEVAESAMREIVGESDIQPILTGARQQTERKVHDLIQKVLDNYKAGITVNQVQLLKSDPPSRVIDSFRDVQAARADQERLRNEALAYSNRIVPEAQGEAKRILQSAQGYREKAIADATGQAARFLKIYEEYRKAPDITRRRMFLETMEQVFGRMDKIIVDNKGGQSVVPFLPLQELTAPKKKNEGGQ